MDSSQNLAITLGAIEIGITANTFLYGLMVMQTVSYFRYGFKDSWMTRALVWWTLALDTAHSIIACEMLWKMTVTRFGDASVLTESMWEYTCSPFFIVAASVPIQIFLSFRIRRIARKPWNNYVFAFLVLTSTTQGILGFYLAARLLVGVTTTEGYNSYIRVASGWTGVGLACDVCITVLLIFILWSKRTGFKGTDYLIIRIITVAVETAIPVSLFAIGHLISIKLGPQTGLHELFAFPLGRLYTNTLLATLNSRGIQVPKGSIFSDSESKNVNFIPSHMRGTTVHVEVQQEISMQDMYSPTKHTEPEHIQHNVQGTLDRKVGSFV